MRKFITYDMFELALRIWTAIYLWIYGFGKLFQFKDATNVDVLIKDATGFELMWAFFGYTQAFPVMIGAIQIIGALLLLWNRTKLFAAIILTPLFLNIIFLDILYEIPKGAFSYAVLFQCVFFLIIYKNYKKVCTAFKTLLLPDFQKFNWKEFLVTFFIAVVLVVCLQIILTHFTKLL